MSRSVKKRKCVSVYIFRNRQDCEFGPIWQIDFGAVSGLQREVPWHAFCQRLSSHHDSVFHAAMTSNEFDSAIFSSQTENYFLAFRNTAGDRIHLFRSFSCDCPAIIALSILSLILYIIFKPSQGYTL